MKLVDTQLEEELPVEETVEQIKAQQIAKARAEGWEYEGREPGEKKLKVIQK
jgi:hypothetical protein